MKTIALFFTLMTTTVFAQQIIYVDDNDPNFQRSGNVQILDDQAGKFARFAASPASVTFTFNGVAAGEYQIQVFVRGDNLGGDSYFSSWNGQTQDVYDVSKNYQQVNKEFVRHRCGSGTDLQANCDPNIFVAIDGSNTWTINFREALADIYSAQLIPLNPPAQTANLDDVIQDINERVLSVNDWSLGTHRINILGFDFYTAAADTLIINRMLPILTSPESYNTMIFHLHSNNGQLQIDDLTPYQVQNTLISNTGTTVKIEKIVDNAGQQDTLTAIEIDFFDQFNGLSLPVSVFCSFPVPSQKARKMPTQIIFRKDSAEEIDARIEKYFQNTDQPFTFFAVYPVSKAN